MTASNELARVGDERLVFFVLLRSQVSSGEFMLLIQVDKSSRHRCKQVSRTRGRVLGATVRVVYAIDSRDVSTVHSVTSL